jgi:steroid 5-alpha reductase family enzyme
VGAGPIQSLLAAVVLMVTVMAVVWWIAVRIGNAGIVDIAWSLNFSVLAGLYAILGQGYLPRRLLIAGMVALWSLRLGGYLYARVMGHHPVEDGRYQKLRREWAPSANRRFLLFFQIQAVLNVILSVPILIACANPEPGIHPLEWAGLAIWAIALVGETVADRQLHRFRNDPANEGRTCQIGLWHASRHPNYFFEWLIWVALFVFALASPQGIAVLYCPALMLFFLLRVTGIPMTEEQALKSRGDEYREYQRTTSIFVPWFRRA